MTKHNHKILFAFLYLGMPALLAWIGCEYSYYSAAQKAKQQEEAAASVYRNNPNSNITFYDLPRVSLSMSSNTGASGMMKLDVSLEIAKKDLQRVVDFEPRIIEKIVVFMQNQSYEKFQEPNGARELRRGLEHEIRTGAFPVDVAAVDVREMVFE